MKIVPSSRATATAAAKRQKANTQHELVSLAGFLDSGVQGPSTSKSSVGTTAVGRISFNVQTAASQSLVNSTDEDASSHSLPNNSPRFACETNPSGCLSSPRD